MVYHDELVVTLPVKRSGRGNLSLNVTYQGCAEAGLCYPPVTRTLSVALPVALPGAGGGPGGGAAAGVAGPTGASAAAMPATPGSYVSEQDRLAALLEHGSLLAVLLQFFVGGLLLAFTPCVLPMVPILSGLIVGQGRSVTTSRAFLLSLTYVLGMALTYTVTGALFAAAGKQVQAVFQQPWIILLFAAAVRGDGAVDVRPVHACRCPASSRRASRSSATASAAAASAASPMMGMLSALIVTTCVGPVLVGSTDRHRPDRRYRCAARPRCLR